MASTQQHNKQENQSFRTLPVNQASSPDALNFNSHSAESFSDSEIVPNRLQKFTSDFHGGKDNNLIGNNQVKCESGASSGNGNYMENGNKDATNNSLLCGLDESPAISGNAKEEHRRSSKARAYLNQMLERKRLPSENEGTSWSERQVASVAASKNNESNALNKSTNPTSNKNDGVGLSRASRSSQNVIKTSSATDLKSFFFENEDEKRGVYLVEAATQISTAHNAMSNGDYELAFASYKSAINILLQGVQGDTDELRVEAVRRKTAKYLHRAEEIHEKYLKNMLNSTALWQTGQELKRRNYEDKEGESCIRNEEGGNVMQKPSPRHTSNDLTFYKVLGVVDKVLLVVDTRTNQTLIIKVLSKCTKTSSQHRKAVIPTNVPYMVKLHRFYSTEHALYLVLEYASGGKLWDQLPSFWERCEGCDKKAEEPSQGEQSMKQKTSYSCDVPPNTNPVLVDDNTKPGMTKEAGIVTEFNKQFTIDSLGTDDDDGEACNEIKFHVEDLDIGRVSDENMDVADNGVDEVDESFSAELLSEQDLSAIADDSLKMRSATPQFSSNVLGSSPLLTQFYNKNSSPCLSANSSIEGDEVLSEQCITDNCSEPSNIKVSRYINEHGISTVEPAAIFCNTKNKSTPIKSTCTATYSDCEKEKDIPREDNSVNEQLGLKPQKREDNTVIMDGEKVDSHFSLFKLMGSASALPYRLPESVICSWAAELIVAIGTLHSVGILCRNLQPRNILLSADGFSINQLTLFEGHIRLSYFGKWKQVNAPVDNVLQNLYSAPEITSVTSRKTEACDWWSFGTLLYELFVGKPLHVVHPSGISSHTILILPDFLSAEARSLLTGLLQFHATERLGYGVRGLDDLMSHPFFANIEWDKLVDMCSDL